MKITALFLLALLSSRAFAQQFPVNTLFWTNYENINPGAAGVLYKHHATAWYRNQWEGVNGAPNTILAGYNMRSEKLRGGIGVNATYGTIGSSELWNARLNYSYHWKINEESTLGIGASLGAYSISTTYTYIPPVTMDDPSIQTTTSTMADLNIGAGLFYQRKNLLIGLSGTEILQERNPFGYYLAEFWLTGEYTIDFSENFQLKPTVLINTDGGFSTMPVTANLRAVLYKNIWFGPSYRSSDSFGIMAGYDIAGKFRVGYMYERTSNELKNISRGSHEVVIGFLLK